MSILQQAVGLKTNIHKVCAAVSQEVQLAVSKLVSWGEQVRCLRWRSLDR